MFVSNRENMHQIEDAKEEEGGEGAQLSPYVRSVRTYVNIKARTERQMPVGTRNAFPVALQLRPLSKRRPPPKKQSRPRAL